MFKSKFGIGKSAMRLDGVRSNDDVTLGVLDAVKHLGGLPETINQITIHDEVKIRNIGKRETIGLGVCTRKDRNSRIDIYAGSIRLITDRGLRHIDQRSLAKEVALHEIDHSNYNQEEQDGFWFGVELNDNDKEERAEGFARDNFINKF